MAGYRKATSLALLFACCVSAPARAEDSCLDIQRNYDLVKAEAVSVQTNAALFAAADSGCEDLARKLIGEGASVEARDARGAMPLTHAAREGRLKLVALFLANGAPINARNVDGGTALFAAEEATASAAKEALSDVMPPTRMTPLAPSPRTSRT